jgi:hypothetical protein
MLKFFGEDPGSGMETVRIRDPKRKKVEFGIRDKHPGSATLLASSQNFYILSLPKKFPFYKEQRKVLL